jgi:hypothetical protein
MITGMPSMVAANNRFRTSALAYGETRAMESCVIVGKYTAANNTAGRASPSIAVDVIGVCIQLSKNEKKRHALAAV